MSKRDFIEKLIKAMDSDVFGQARLRKIDQPLWAKVSKAEVFRLTGLSFSELEALYQDSEELFYEMAE